MATIKELLKEIEGAPDGPEIAAIFDFDGTLIAGYSATALIREQVRRGDLSLRDLAEVMMAMVNFGLGNVGFSAMMVLTSQFMRGIREQTYVDLGEDLYRDQIARLIYPESRSVVEAHLAKGHTVAMISSATPYQIEPAARDLGIEHVLCTHLEVEDGVFTGGVVSPTCFGEGKVIAAEELAERVGADLDRSFFYSDSTDDIELLERVGKPRALNPSDKLAGIAEDRGWPSASFGSRGRPTVSEFIRSAAATASLPASFLAGLPIWALTGSRRDAQNFSTSLFADTASALIGLKLNVKGEGHLWSQRPAIFVFNHQSKADVIVAMRLVRRDIAGIGKQEIKNMPIIGQVLQYAGVVLIDRADAASAIKSMAPLVDAIKKEGRSLLVAPEGTRTVSPRLAPFKKGPFHLAIQARVPMVPIVIRNAGDVAPKGDFVFRPATVDVEVLPPVDTTSWSAETIDEHVAEVRGMFLKALGQTEELTQPQSSSPRRPRSKPQINTRGGTETKTKARSGSRSKSAGSSKTQKPPETQD